MNVPPADTGLEWGTLGQWAGPLVAILISLWAAFSKRDEKAIDELKGDRTKLFQRVDDLDRKVAAIEVDIKHLPSIDDLHEVRSTVAEDVHKVTLAVEKLSASLGAKLEAITARIDTAIAQTERAQERLARREDDMIARLGREAKDR